LVSLLVLGEHAEAQAPMPFRNPEIPVEKRVDDLMSRLTLARLMLPVSSRKRRFRRRENVAPTLSRAPGMERGTQPLSL